MFSLLAKISSVKTVLCIQVFRSVLELTSHELVLWVCTCIESFELSATRCQSSVMLFWMSVWICDTELSTRPSSSDMESSESSAHILLDSISQFSSESPFEVFHVSSALSHRFNVVLIAFVLSINGIFSFNSRNCCKIISTQTTDAIGIIFVQNISCTSWIQNFCQH